MSTDRIVALAMRMTEIFDHGEAMAERAATAPTRDARTSAMLAADANDPKVDEAKHALMDACREHRQQEAIPSAQPAPGAITLDRSDAVNLARNLLEVRDCKGITERGVRVLCKAVMAMDQALAAAPAAPSPAQPAIPDLRARLGEAHDASLDDDHRACRSILAECIRLLDAAPAATQPTEECNVCGGVVLLTARAATQPAEPTPKRSIILTGNQLKEALEFIAPDHATSQERLDEEVSIQWHEGGVDDGDGKDSEPGYRCWMTDYPQEGSIPLDREPRTPLRATQPEGQEATIQSLRDQIAELEELCTAIVTPCEEAFEAFQAAFLRQLKRRKHHRKGWEDSAEVAGAKAFIATVAKPLLEREAIRAAQAGGGKS